jgi:hypothetical protein
MLTLPLLLSSKFDCACAHRKWKVRYRFVFGHCQYGSIMKLDFPFQLQKNDLESCQMEDLRETVLADFRVMYI